MSIFGRYFVMLFHFILKFYISTFLFSNCLKLDHLLNDLEFHVNNLCVKLICILWIAQTCLQRSVVDCIFAISIVRTKYHAPAVEFFHAQCVPVGISWTTYKATKLTIDKDVMIA